MTAKGTINFSFAKKSGSPTLSSPAIKTPLVKSFDAFAPISANTPPASVSSAAKSAPALVVPPQPTIASLAPRKKLVIPNVRKLFLADPGYTFFEADLKGADAQVVAWEADDEDLKAAFRAGLDVHAKNAEDMWGSKFTSLSGEARDKKRQQNKRAVHLTNYGGSARALAMVEGWTVHESDSFQKRWFSIHPKIKSNFHDKTHKALAAGRTVRNVYGFRMVYFDRIDSCFGQALAWVPQSTVAIATYLGAFALEEACPSVEMLLQNHDALGFQFPTATRPSDEEITKHLTVLTPYPDPLYIPWDLKSSTKSWGDVK
jgi:hypothetical protein